MAVALYSCGARRARENARPESEETCACGLGVGVDGGVALSPFALLLSASDLFAVLSAALFVASFLFESPFNLDGTMTGKLPTVDGDFVVAAFRGVEFEEAMLLGDAEIETSAVMFDD